MKLDHRLLVSLFLGVEAAAGCASGPAATVNPAPSAEIAGAVAMYGKLPSKPTSVSFAATRGLAKESPRPPAAPDATPEVADGGVADPHARRRHPRADPAPDPDQIRPGYCPPCGMG